MPCSMLQALAEAEVRLAELEHRKRKLEEAERASEERLAAVSKEASAKVGSSTSRGSSMFAMLKSS